MKIGAVGVHNCAAAVHNCAAGVHNCARLIFQM